MNDSKQELIAKLNKKDYRHAYLDEFLNVLIATQIRVLRQQRNLKQGQLAELAGMKQSRISELEDVSHAYLTTLKRIAKALDVALIVKFESFGKILKEIDDYAPEHLGRPSYDEENLAEESTTASEYVYLSGEDVSNAVLKVESTPGMMVIHGERQSGTSTATDLIDLVIANKKKGTEWRGERQGKRQGRG